jgi:hypothetical protein
VTVDEARMLEDAAARRTWDPFWGNAALRHIVLCGEPLTVGWNTASNHITSS